ncbi:hypothetical protein ACFLQN_03300 [Candidatus Aenigmatarchaeota archaeon]
MSYSVTSKIKEFIKKSEMNTASDLSGALDKKIECMLTKAIERAKSNDRKTVRASDL